MTAPINALVKDLSNDNETDYTLVDECRSCWISVGPASIYIKRCDEGVVIDVFRKGDEMDRPVTSTWATWNELEDGEAQEGAENGQ